MCGILTVINKNILSDSVDLINACKIIKHRGPDDEGFLTWIAGEKPKIWAGGDTSSSTKEFWRYESLQFNQKFKVGFGHRRLSILDLSPNGHQPMVHKETGISITYNGEIYNFLDIKSELEQKGYIFHSKTDSEVLLLSWVEWGKNCLKKLNGMFAFVVLDPKDGGTIYAVRDRFGVKPLFLFQNENNIIFCSEIKQIRSFKNYKLSINKQKVFQYLAHGIVDNDTQTFDINVQQIPGGSFATINLNNENNEIKIDKWYELKPQKWQGNEQEAINKFRQLLQESVKLRLRADVTVGSCLSGGLDSSAIVCLAKNILEEIGNHQGQITVTACYEDKRFDEWKFAKEVVDQTKATSHRIFPSFERLTQDFEKLLWHQDDPFPSTSMFSQWCVFAGSADAKLKVMIDGQGSDEQLSGYGGNELSLFTGLLKKGAIIELYNEIINYKKIKGNYPIGFLLGAFQAFSPAFVMQLFPEKYKIIKKQSFPWLATNKYKLDNPFFSSLTESLKNQVLSSPLPSLLRYEDRSSMAWSIESRVPFLDYRFVEFTLGLPENYVFKNGLKKVILRKAMKGIMPENIVNRTDKMGFVTPEEVWLKEEGKEWFKKGVASTIENNPEYFDKNNTLQLVEDIISGKSSFNFTPWRIVCFGKWMEMMKKYSN